MKPLALFFLGASCCIARAQQMDLKALVSQMSGSFTWEMTKPSSQALIRKGERISESYFDGQLFMFRETFSNSNIEQVGFFGYDTKGKQMLSVGLYNVDMGPHILKGAPEKVDQGYQVVFFEKGKKIVLHVENREHHFWEYYSKIEGEWTMDDLRIDFYRKN
jgi:hypothetical protein